MKAVYVRRITVPAVIAGLAMAGISTASASAGADELAGIEVVDPDELTWVGTENADGTTRVYDDAERRSVNDAFRVEQEALIGQEIRATGAEVVEPEELTWVGSIEPDGSIRMYDDSERAAVNDAFQSEQAGLIEAGSAALPDISTISPFTASVSCNSTRYKVVARYPAEGPAWRGFCYSGAGTISVVPMHTDVLGVCPGPQTGRIYAHYANGNKAWSTWRGGYPDNLSTCFNFSIATKTYSQVSIWAPNGPNPVSVNPLSPVAK
ncbi:hypothetical protein H9623_07015 [Oerskovia sp. Sa1BUA8]|uniref:Uncharacterized protein n=1 Tax=Oerskovia douganii TaxID=2762210 RepID=A0A9D5UBQ3_9CELL|nr:hypothetical protein [Oerskovia douganii]MBE7700056.1 hypothetical protein [Oerskovia douganii]